MYNVSNEHTQKMNKKMSTHPLTRITNRARGSLRASGARETLMQRENCRNYCL